MSGTQDIVIAGGVESMTGVPMGANLAKGLVGMPNSPAAQAIFGKDGFYSQFTGAEMVRQHATGTAPCLRSREATLLLPFLLPCSLPGGQEVPPDAR